MGVKIWMVAAESAPYVQTGGLGDVMQALPEVLVKRGFYVRRLIPAYGFLDRRNFYLEAQFDLHIASGVCPISFWTKEEESGVQMTLVQCDELFNREDIYGPRGQEYPDNAQRFAIFCRAVTEFANRMDLPPDVLHAHDWHAALIPMFVRFSYTWSVPVKTVFSIHNMAYQGRFPRLDLKWLGLPPSVENQLFTPDGIEFYGDVNYLKAGLQYADKIITVSPSYVSDILTPEYGCGLDGVLRNRQSDLKGILNGVYDPVWNPATDEYLPKTYTKGSFIRAKEAARKEVKKLFGLPPTTRPLISMVGRLADQKGVDILLDSAFYLIGLGLDICVLGDGDPEISKQLTHLARHLPQRFGVCTNYDDRRAHLLFAGSDFTVVPSRFEPCGLTQLHAMRYGSVPIVNPTGGLRDTVIDWSSDPDHGTGFWLKSLNKEGLVSSVQMALNLRSSDRDAWSALQRRCMDHDSSWTRSAESYVGLYKALIPQRFSGISEVKIPAVEA